MSEAEVITCVEGGLGRLTLNRPGALHALTTNMCRLMTDALLAWQRDPAISAVMIDHAGERGFCAGGDIRMLADSGKGDGAAAREFWLIEYRLDHLLFVYPKPVITIMDGITMGGGVGLSDPAKYRVATERTTYAMPETGIGLFPDVGGGWFLPRLRNHAGLWLALTGARIKAADCYALEIATHVVDSANLPELKAAIAADPTHIPTALASFEVEPGPAPVASRLDDIERLFGQPSVEDIVAALVADGSEWALDQLATMRTKSPQTLKVVLRQLAAGARMASFADNMVMEYRIGARVVHKHDFIEGVRAVIVDKDNAPKWNPPELGGVTEADLDEIFAPLPADQEWTPLPQALETSQ
jgi:enoyl-CoA hydratase